jgi:hypothetical protein
MLALHWTVNLRFVCEQLPFVGSRYAMIPTSVAPAAGPPKTADDWCDLGDDGDLHKAVGPRDCFLAALRRDRQHVRAWQLLGRYNSRHAPVSFEGRRWLPQDCFEEAGRFVSRWPVWERVGAVLLLYDGLSRSGGLPVPQLMAGLVCLLDGSDDASVADPTPESVMAPFLRTSPIVSTAMIMARGPLMNVVADAGVCLRTLTVSTDETQCTEALIRVLRGCPDLRVLDVSLWDAESDDAVVGALCDAIAALPLLAEFEYVVPRGHDSNAVLFAGALRRLRPQRLLRCSAPIADEVFVGALLHHLPTLRHLELVTEQFTHAAALLLASSLAAPACAPHLRIVDLSGSAFDGDGDANATDIDVVLNALRTGGAPLCELRLRGAELMTSWPVLVNLLAALGGATPCTLRCFAVDAMPVASFETLCHAAATVPRLSRVAIGIYGRADMAPDRRPFDAGCEALVAMAGALPLLRELSVDDAVSSAVARRLPRYVRLVDAC